MIVRKSLLELQKRQLPEILSYRDVAAHNSVLNTLPYLRSIAACFTLRWVKNIGMEEMERRNNEKARLLYEAVDNSSLFYGVAQKSIAAK